MSEFLKKTLGIDHMKKILEIFKIKLFWSKTVLKFVNFEEGVNSKKKTLLIGTSGKKIENRNEQISSPLSPRVGTMDKGIRRRHYDSGRGTFWPGLTPWTVAQSREKEINSSIPLHEGSKKKLRSFE